jgi:hypothetical protein
VQRLAILSRVNKLLFLERLQLTPGLACTKAGQVVDILYQSIVSFKEYCPSHALLSKLLLRTFIDYTLTFSAAAL